MPNKIKKKQRQQSRRRQPKPSLSLGSGAGAVARMGGIHRFTRFTDSTLLTLTATSASGGSVTLNNSGMLLLTTTAIQQVSWYSIGLAFALADLPGVAEFTNLFERYRFLAVDVILTPFYTMCAAPVVAGNGAIGGFVHTIVDYNDYGVISASQAGLALMKERPSYTTNNITFMKPIRYRVVPRVAVPAYAGSSFSGYSNMAAPWIDSVSTDVQHYGLKFVFEVADTGAIVQYVNFKMELKYTFEVTDVK